MSGRGTWGRAPRGPTKWGRRLSSGAVGGVLWITTPPESCQGRRAKRALTRFVPRRPREIARFRGVDPGGRAPQTGRALLRAELPGSLPHRQVSGGRIWLRGSHWVALFDSAEVVDRDAGGKDARGSPGRARADQSDRRGRRGRERGQPDDLGGAEGC